MVELLGQGRAVRSISLRAVDLLGVARSSSFPFLSVYRNGFSVLPFADFSTRGGLLLPRPFAHENGLTLERGNNCRALDSVKRALRAYELHNKQKFAFVPFSKRYGPSFMIVELVTLPAHRQ